MLSLEQFKKGLQEGSFAAELEKIYGGDTPKQTLRLGEIAAQFALHFTPDASDIAVFSAPGRSEIGGNHTDHNKGLVLAAAVSLDIIAVASKNVDRMIRVHSEGFEGLDVCDTAILHHKTVYWFAMI